MHVHCIIPPFDKVNCVNILSYMCYATINLLKNDLEPELESDKPGVGKLMRVTEPLEIEVLEVPRSPLVLWTAVAIMAKACMWLKLAIVTSIPTAMWLLLQNSQ